MDDFRLGLETAGIKVICLSGAFGVLSIAWNMLMVLRAYRPDIVHAHSPRLKVLARILRPPFPYRLISTYHNTFERHHPAIRVAETFFHRVDDMLISCSQEVADTIGWPTKVVPNGIRFPELMPPKSVDLRKQLGLANTDVIFACVANLWYKKNHAGLLTSFAEAFDSGPHLVLFGEGDQRIALESQIRKLGIKERVHLMGADPTAAHLTAGADIFCLVSLHEGLPLALLEAMANSLPCIASKAGGMPTVVLDGETGLLVDAQDTTAIATAMRDLADDSNKRQNMGHAGRQRVRDYYQIRTMVDHVENLYVEVLSG